MLVHTLTEDVAQRRDGLVAKQVPHLLRKRQEPDELVRDVKDELVLTVVDDAGFLVESLAGAQERRGRVVLAVRVYVDRGGRRQGEVEDPDAQFGGQTEERRVVLICLFAAFVRIEGLPSFEVLRFG